MRTHLVAWVAVLATTSLLVAPPSIAQINLEWNDCNASCEMYGVTFDCDNPDTAYRLVAWFTPPYDIPNVVAMTGYVLIGAEGIGDWPPFWRLGPYDCNADYFAPSALIPEGSSLEDPWRCSTNTLGLFYYQELPPDRDYLFARIIFDITRPPDHPVSLAAGVDYFAFQLDFFMGGSECCAGCEAPVAFAWDQVTLTDADGVPYRLAGAGPAGACAPVNGSLLCWTTALQPAGGDADAPMPFALAGGERRIWACDADIPPPPPCGPTPAHTSSWGRLKTIYR